MVMTIDVPEVAVREAALQGKSVETLLRERFSLPDLFPIGRSGRDPELAAQAIERLSERHTLAGLELSELINEGRRT